MNTNIINSMKREMNRRRYSKRTIESYIFCIGKFLSKFNKNPRKITKKEITNYLENLSEKGRSGSTMNVYLSSIKFLMNDIFRRNINLNIHYSRRPKRLPEFLNKNEVKILFDSIKNPKHRLMIELMYSAGLRVGELVSLKIKDLETNFGWVRKGKGNKDRMFIIAESLKGKIINYIDDNNLDWDDYLFGARDSRHLSIRTVQEIVKKAKKKAKIKKNVHPHTLRHSFATHLIENENDICDVQRLLGHNSVKTTMIYVHMAHPKMISIKSPYDNL